jgi:tetratricopeptide (TPR) repeat protein
MFDIRHSAFCAFLYFAGFLLLVTPASLSADQTYTKNSKANRLYKQGKYDEAQKLYDDALLETPGNRKLSMNKGSSLHKLGEYDKAAENYENALSIEDTKARADCHYNLGNTLFHQAQELEAGGNPAAAEKYKAAYENYIKALDIRPKDMDTKWNLQLAYQRMQQLENQQKQQNDRQNKDQEKQDQQKGQDKQNNQDDKDNQDKQKQEDQQQQQSQQQDKQDRKERAQPQPQEQQKENLEKKEAERLLMQFSDDADELNKPRKTIHAVEGGRPEKDW